MIKVFHPSVILRYKCRAKLLLTRAAGTLYLLSPEKRNKTKQTHTDTVFVTSTQLYSSQVNSTEILSICNYVHHIFQVNKQSNLQISSSHVY